MDQLLKHIHIIVEEFTFPPCFINVIERKEDGCSSIRREIQERIWEKLSDTWLEKNVSGDGEYALHHQASCVCERGEIGKAKKVAANEKKKAYFQTEEGKAKKKKKADDDREKTKCLEM